MSPVFYSHLVSRPGRYIVGISHATRESIPFSFLIAEVERYTHLQLQVTYCTELDWPSHAPVGID